MQLGYTLDPNDTPYDRQECFFGITDRMALRGISRKTTYDDISLFLQSNGFESKDILDIYIIHQNRQSLLNQLQFLEKLQNSKKGKGKKKKKKKKGKNKKIILPKIPRYVPGFSIITFSNFELAKKAFTKLSH